MQAIQRSAIDFLSCDFCDGGVMDRALMCGGKEHKFKNLKMRGIFSRSQWTIRKNWVIAKLHHTTNRKITDPGGNPDLQ